MLVKAQGLTKRFGRFTALDHCDLEIEPGVVFGLLGPNGAGKTTLLRLLLGFMFPTAGSASINGFDCHSQTVQVHRCLTYLPGDAQLFGSMKGRQILKFFARLRSDCDFNQAVELADRLDLDLKRRVAFMSTGMRQKLALCVCLSTRTDLTILDEPTANLDPNVRSEVIKIIDEIKRKGGAVIFSSHVLSEIEDVCDRVVIMRSGHIVRDLQLSDLKTRHRICAESVNREIVIPDAFHANVSLKPKNTMEADEQEISTATNSYVFDTQGDLMPIMNWLSSEQVSNLRVEPIGLRNIYDQCHFDETPVEKNPTTSTVDASVESKLKEELSA